jgi:hypothetical protein
MSQDNIKHKVHTELLQMNTTIIKVIYLNIHPQYKSTSIQKMP